MSKKSLQSVSQSLLCVLTQTPLALIYTTDYHYDPDDPDRTYEEVQGVILQALGLLDEQ